MKPPRILMILALGLAGGFGAFAQTNGSAIPRATDYSAFSRFVTERNIFDPNRQPHRTSGRTGPVSRPRPHSASAPAFTFVGTMSYEKGLFAFFSGNDADLKKVLPVTEKIAGFTVVEIVPGRVTLVSTNQPEKLVLKVGDVMRQESGKWELAGMGEMPAGASATETTSPSSDESTTAAPASAAAPNDILKKLMEKRKLEKQ